MFSKYIDLVVLLSVSEGSLNHCQIFLGVDRDRGRNSNEEVFCHLTNCGMLLVSSLSESDSNKIMDLNLIIL